MLPAQQQKIFGGVGGGQNTAKRKAYIGLHQVAKNTTALTRSPYQLYMVICQFCIFSLFLENQLMLL